MTLDSDQETDKDPRARALAVLAGSAGEAGSAVGYRSEGRLLIIGKEADAIEPARALAGRLQCTVVAPTDGDSEKERLGDVRLFREPRGLRVNGYLGHFTLSAYADEDSLVALGEFDLVLDLNTPPLLRQPVPPPGYFAPGADLEALNRAIDSLPDMVGEFEKPKYFDFDPNICAHSRSGQRGCSRCIDVCPSEAIVSSGDVVEVNPYLCQGIGSCVASCPSGAMRYAVPTVAERLAGIRQVLGAYREAGGRTPWLMFYESEASGAAIESCMGRLPEHVLPVGVEEIGAIGMDCWLASIAYGADAVVLLAHDDLAMGVAEEMNKQLGYARQIMVGMGYDPACLSMLDQATICDDSSAWPELPQDLIASPAVFVAPDEKRTIVKMAVDHLYEHAPKPAPAVGLPVAAPFGEIAVDKEACTLCMGCVAVCPSAALIDGKELPQLKFLEWNCVQCGLCEAACPESAIERKPRFLFDARARQQSRVLHEEPPFCCVTCGKAFATRSMMERMAEKLEQHWMFQTDEARRRMQMCEDCRVKDMMMSGPSGNGSGGPAG